ncbi:hypothetical protein Tco_1268597, partial [Tanacetum coccineum]
MKNVQIENVEQQENNQFQQYSNKDINDTVKNIAKLYTDKENDQKEHNFGEEAMFEEGESDRIIIEKIVEDKALNTYRRRKFQKLLSEKPDDDVASTKEDENSENTIIATQIQTTTEETVNDSSAPKVNDGFVKITYVAGNIPVSEANKKTEEFDEKLIQELMKKTDVAEDVCIIIGLVESSGFIDEQKKNYVEKEKEKIDSCEKTNEQEKEIVQYVEDESCTKNEKKEEENLNAQEKKNEVDFTSFRLEDLYHQSSMNEKFTSSEWYNCYENTKEDNNQFQNKDFMLENNDADMIVGTLSDNT